MQDYQKDLYDILQAEMQQEIDRILLNSIRDQIGRETANPKNCYE